jgi:hypothetical protein
MGGGLMQLVAYGAQDIYLSGNPQITFFKVVYRRHTNFSMESIEQTFNGTTNFDRKVTCTISRNGDLINRMYLQVELPELVQTGKEQNVVTQEPRPNLDENGDPVLDENGEPTYEQDGDGNIIYDEVITQEPLHFEYVNWVGHALVKSVEIEVGGQRIDKHYGDWLHIWNELSQTESHWDVYKSMLCGSYKDNGTKKLVGIDQVDVDQLETEITATSGKARSLYIPLQFWFCRNPGLALPLIALQYHEVKVNIEFAKLEELVLSNLKTEATTTATASVSGTMSANLFVDYVYLDTDERRRFAQVSHEYLIEQLQFTGDESSSRNIKLNFNHPVKELVWVERDNTKFFGTYKTSFTSAQLTLNSHDRFSKRKPQFFQLVQPYQHHERVPKVGTGINVYSFALKPEEHQPSGSCNMSRIDTATLKLENADHGSKDVVKVFAVNYNVLRIMSGMGGLSAIN